MPHKGPHISIESESLVNRILHINLEEFEEWPEAVRRLTLEIAEELFLVRYNPFVNPDTVKQSVLTSFEQYRRALDLHYANTINEGITMFWSAHEADQSFRNEIITRLREILPEENIDLRASSRVENATDATDLRLELPLLVVTPSSAEEVSAVVRLANEMQFALIPRGGGSGMTGGAIPARKRTVILSLSRMMRILDVNAEKHTITAEAGVLTIDAINAAAASNMLFSVDPASKTASTIGGNISENSGGPLAVEYGTTIDNILSYRMVTPTGETIEVIRKEHPGHKIEENDEAIFEVRDLTGGLRSVVTLRGSDLRKPGLGKDVTNKNLNGLPGVQKEGVDGIIVDATFVLHEKLKFKKVVVLEFFGRSMHNATLAINSIMDLRGEFIAAGSVVRLTMLEEFNSKYVQAIEYAKKSQNYEGDPISVLIIQLDGNDRDYLEVAMEQLVSRAAAYDGVEAFVAADDKEAELYWEDRHKLSAISKRTSGFKINEDIVIPLAALPEFALFLEGLNVQCMARAYRRALQEIGRLHGVAEDDREFNREFTYASRLIKGEYPQAPRGEMCAATEAAPGVAPVAEGTAAPATASTAASATPAAPANAAPVETAADAVSLSDLELQLHAVLYIASLKEAYPQLAAKISKIEERMLASQVVVASHMHAGDGNCHVNIPVNSGNVKMVEEGYQVAERVMEKAHELGGAISGEHGIGITKIGFQDEEKIKDLRAFKQLVDPRNILNPAKLTQRELPVSSFTFSFNRLIADIEQSGLAGKNRLIELLAKVQMCTRCGKCKEVCPMHYPDAGMYYYPRNRNMSLGALVEAAYYSQVNTGVIAAELMEELRRMIEHCTGCGKCMAVCPCKIDSPEVALSLRSFLDEEGQGGHPLKHAVLSFVAKDPAKRVPVAAKLASFGQKTSNKFLPIVPAFVRSKFSSPLFAGPGPAPAYRNLFEGIKLERGGLFVPDTEVRGTALYFTGCGGSMFYRSIGLAGIALLLEAGWAVLVPQEPMCCGYPLLAAGMQAVFAENQDRNIGILKQAVQQAAEQGYPVSYVATSCGSCREGIERHYLPEVLTLANEQGGKFGVVPRQVDVTQLLLMPADAQGAGMSLVSGAAGKGAGVVAPKRTKLLYHAPCHAEWTGVNKNKAASGYAKAIESLSGGSLNISKGCCGESGMGAMTSPAIYNQLRQRKLGRLKEALPAVDASSPVLVSCPSCKMGIVRNLMTLKDKREVLHTLEFLADERYGRGWRGKIRKLLKQAELEPNKTRRVNMAAISGVTLAAEEQEADD